MRSAYFIGYLLVLSLALCADASRYLRVPEIGYDYEEIDASLAPHHHVPRSLLSRFLALTAPDLQNTLLGSLISYFTPALRKTLQKTLREEFDPLIVGNATTQDLGEVFTIGDCQTTAKIVYDSEILRGLGSVQLDKIEMVPDSDSISYSLLDGATWNSTWVFNATFSALSAEANASLHVDACGVPAMEHKLNFSATVEQPSIYMQIAVKGETASLVLFQSTSRVSSAQVLDLSFHYHMVDAQLSGNFGNLSYVNLGVELGESMYKDSGVFEILMMEALQQALDEQMPFKPSGPS